jgi:hypothetical protein
MEATQTDSAAFIRARVILHPERVFVPFRVHLRPEWKVRPLKLQVVRYYTPIFRVRWVELFEDSFLMESPLSRRYLEEERCCVRAFGYVCGVGEFNSPADIWPTSRVPIHAQHGLSGYNIRHCYVSDVPEWDHAHWEEDA